MHHTRIERIGAVLLLLMFLSLGMWESFGHSCLQQQHSHALIQQASDRGAQIRHSDEIERHDDSQCPVCAATRSSVCALFSPTVLDTQARSLYTVTYVSTTPKLLSFNTSSPRAPPAA